MTSLLGFSFAMWQMYRIHALAPNPTRSQWIQPCFCWPGAPNKGTGLWHVLLITWHLYVQHSIISLSILQSQFMFDVNFHMLTFNHTITRICSHKRHQISLISFVSVPERVLQINKNQWSSGIVQWILWLMRTYAKFETIKKLFLHR